MMVLRRVITARSPISTILRCPTRRSYATEPPAPAPSSVARLEARLPRFLRRITTPLRSAPLSHVTAFLILHELTAIVPLFGLAAAFHYSHWLPPYFSEGKWVSEGVEKFGRWLKKRSWISDADAERGKLVGSGKWWARGEGGVRIVVELATAYAITKVLLPVRLVVSVWATPWFAKWTVLPMTGVMRRMLRRKAQTTKASPAASTGAVAGGAVPKDGGTKVK